MVNYPRRLQLARLPTPLTQLTRFKIPDVDTEIWIKRDEVTGTEVSGNKIRKLEFNSGRCFRAGMQYSHHLRRDSV